MLFVAILCAIEIGHRFGLRTAPEVRGDEVTSNAKAAVMAVVGLLLAFSYSFSSERYDERMAVNWREANAIEKSYFRTTMLEEPAASRLRRILREYLDLRIENGTVPPGDPEVERLDAETRRLHHEMWKTAMPSVQRDRHDVMTVAVVQSLNETIDIAAEQRAARRNHVPDAVTILLLMSTIMASGLLGYSAQEKSVRNLPVWGAFAVVLALVMFSILDLDRPRRGLIRVRTDALVDLREDWRTHNSP